MINAYSRRRTHIWRYFYEGQWTMADFVAAKQWVKEFRPWMTQNK